MYMSTGLKNERIFGFKSKFKPGYYEFNMNKILMVRNSSVQSPKFVHNLYTHVGHKLFLKTVYVCMVLVWFNTTFSFQLKGLAPSCSRGLNLEY